MITVTVKMRRGILITVMMMINTNADGGISGGLNQKSNQICIKDFTCRGCTWNYCSFYLKALRQDNWAKIPTYYFLE